MLVRILKNIFNCKSVNKTLEVDLKQAYQLYQSGELSSADSLLRSILQAEPQNADAWCLRAEIATSLKQADAAIQYYRKTIQINPNICEAHANLGLLLYDESHFDEAINCFERAVQLRPDDAQILNNFGISLLGKGNYGEAKKKFRDALAINSKLDTVWCNLGVLAQRELATKEALICFEKALELRTDSAETHCNYGLTLREVERSDEAIFHLQEAVRIRPNYADAHSNLAIGLQDKGELEQALYHAQEALRLNPDHTEAQCNLSIILKNMGKIEEALKALEVVPDKKREDPNVLMSRAYLLLLMGKFKEGWQLHESRFKQQMYPRRLFPWPEWGGEDLKDKGLLIYAEQGLGDELMYANCFPDAIPKAGQIIIECEPRLKDLFTRSFPRAIVVGRQRNADDKWLESLPTVDYQIGAGSLPKFFRNFSQDFPFHQGYVKADIGKTAMWKEKLEKLGPGLKIGISWRGGLIKTGQVSRSINLSELLPIFNLPNMQFISLQYTDCQQELLDFEKTSGILIHHWTEAIKDYDETAALVEALDVVITVCTSIVHLSGALGQHVWVMTPYVPEWRYGIYGDTIPWYPKAKLFRQTERNNWQPVIEKISTGIKSFKRGSV